MSTICLCMIVRDERGVIERCLRSVRGLIDHWVICDTGSEDGTQGIIGEELAGIPGELYERPWVDFGHNRSEALALARGKADYLLLLDADWTFEAEPGALENLTAEVYFIRHGHPNGAGVSYYNRQLVKGDRKWWYVGAAHEYIETDGPVTERRLAEAWIGNWSDGNVGRERRWRRDAELLSAAVEQNPDSARDIFYLAQTHRDLGELPRAVELYRRRVELAGFDEERFYARYQVGCLLAQLGDWSAAVPALIAAFSARPSRIEPLYQLANGYRVREEYQAAHVFAARALDLPQPDDLLFVEPWMYRWGLLFEYSISAYWVADYAGSLAACERLLQAPDLPDSHREATLGNREFCLKALSAAADIPSGER